jgi:NAD(P)-dependent dehydrogenase (short-subunit alcohol dehydrogenase family)
VTLQGKVALVTGAGQAAGRTYARALGAVGARVVAADCFEGAAKETVSLIERAGGTARYVPVDVTDEESTRAAAAAAVDGFGGIDVLVNNAATYGATARVKIADMTVEQWDRTMAVFVKGAWLMSKAAVPHLAKSSQGSIVNQASVAAYGVDEWLDYGTARGAVIAMTKSMAKELAPLKIRVNALAVGSMGSEAIALGVVMDEAMMTQTPDFQRQLIPRLGTEEDIAGPMLFLADSMSGYMTGQTLVADGGKYFLG